MSTTPDTRYDDATLQKAIDEACQETHREHRSTIASNIVVDIDTMPNHWQSEAPARLALARALLARLPEPTLPDTKTLCADAYASMEKFHAAIKDEIERPWIQREKDLERMVDRLQAKLAKMPEPTPPVVDGKTPAQILFDVFNNDREWEDASDEYQKKCEAAASAVLAAFGQGDLQAAITRMEAELANAKEIITAMHSVKTSELRPISEAGPVPEGCVRLFGHYSDDVERWPINCTLFNDTHFADIRLPKDERTAWQKADDSPALGTPVNADTDPYAALKQAHAEGKPLEYRIGGEWLPCLSPSWICAVEDYRIKPETFTAHGMEWTKHTPGDPMPCDGERQVNWLLESEISGEYIPLQMKASDLMWSFAAYWRYADEPTPEEPLNVKSRQLTVGDVVQLRSGGPAMTIRCFTPENAIICDWFNERGDDDSKVFPAACIQPAEEDQH